MYYISLLSPTPVLGVNGTCNNRDNTGGGYRNYATARAPAVKRANQDIEVTHHEGMSKVMSTLSIHSGPIFERLIIDWMK